MNVKPIALLTALFCATSAFALETQEDFAPLAPVSDDGEYEPSPYDEESSPDEDYVVFNNDAVIVDIDKLSEAFGNYLGRGLKDSGIAFNYDKLSTGLQNGIQGKPSPLSQEQYEQMMATLQVQAFTQLSDTNLQKANDFLKENAKVNGVVELIPSKLQYTVVTPGSGETVKPTDSPLINYSGTFADGTVFSTSEETGGAITIPLSHTIPGFQKGIDGMREGEKRRLFIHPDLGYGSAPGHLPPNSLLIFDIEVVKANSTEDDDSGDADFDDIEEPATPDQLQR